MNHKYIGVDITSLPKPEAQYIIDCPYCGLKEDITLNPPLTRIERIEHHKRKECVNKWRI